MKLVFLASENRTEGRKELEADLELVNLTSENRTEGRKEPELE
jgi:hypothetical protein